MCNSDPRGSRRNMVLLRSGSTKQGVSENRLDKNSVFRTFIFIPLDKTNAFTHCHFSTPDFFFAKPLVFKKVKPHFFTRCFSLFFCTAQIRRAKTQVVFVKPQILTNVKPHFFNRVSSLFFEQPQPGAASAQACFVKPKSSKRLNPTFCIVFPCCFRITQARRWKTQCVKAHVLSSKLGCSKTTRKLDKKSGV